MTITPTHPSPTTQLNRLGGPPIEIPDFLSTMWIAILLADVLRAAHETLRPGFVEELANEGTYYGRQVTDGTLLWSGFALVFIVSVVVLARVLPRRWNRRVNVLAALMMSGGVLASWPKDPDDFVFGTFQVLGSVIVVLICARWAEDNTSLTADDDDRTLVGV